MDSELYDAPREAEADDHLESTSLDQLSEGYITALNFTVDAAGGFKKRQ
jgi:hypothetical protein